MHFYYIITVCQPHIMSNIDGTLKSIITAANAANNAVEDLTSATAQVEHPSFIQNLLEKSGQTEAEGISLLSLKNSALASYINNLVLIVLGQIDRMDNDENENLKNEAIERSIAQRVTLEKGVKPLERKITYQIENLMKTFSKAESQELQAKKEEEDADESNDDGSDGKEDNDVDSEEDEMAFRPDAAALAKLAPQATKSPSNEKYKPPKISAMAPPTSKDSDAKNAPTQKLQSMEEYLQEQSDLPTAEASIGSTIVSHGRGGVKTQYDRKKEKEIQTYEEANFTRLPTAQTKKSFKQKQRDMANQFAGEDWSIFNKDKDLDSGTSRKRKPTTSWDRVKRKRT
ncbi:Lcp5 protein [Candida orthopsilosis Co 90-125]|uniref:Lcp5 protein n=1 Tax=Candida orthopsilosis (strain 90-125) TaxID=1136231 RepID=H8X413_CANO9|nr:Lcp5 protein [Candida orthopsilosis Co 90-125]CCG25801.1 Lcp5 protein [Candida orthopsilosis Co 90-125]